MGGLVRKVGRLSWRGMGGLVRKVRRLSWRGMSGLDIERDGWLS